MAGSTPAMESETSMSREETSIMHWLSTMDFFRPNTSEITPDGTSNSRLATWNTLSANPISTRENPLAASSATQEAPAI